MAGEYDGDFEAIRRSLAHIEGIATEARDAARFTNGRVTGLEQELYGAADRTGRPTGRGLLYRVDKNDERIEQVEKQAIGIAKSGEGATMSKAATYSLLAIVLTGVGVMVAVIVAVAS